MGQDSVLAAIEATAAAFGGFDLLVNNAGISPKNAEGRKRMIWETPPQEWRQVVDVNLNGYFLALRAVLPHMMQARRGAVVNVGSPGWPALFPDCRGGVCDGQERGDRPDGQAAGEVAEFGVRVNCIAPGRIETGMAAVAGGSFNDAIRESTPLRRLGQPQDIAEAALFLLSDAASFITGETLVVSGGRGL